MNQKSKKLLSQARSRAQELSEHPVLSRYWGRLSLVVKGTTARGNADRYSDIDLVFFAERRTRTSIIKGYCSAGLSSRKDGVCIMLKNGHYHIESFQQLEGYFADKDFVHIWECQNAIPLHDPNDAFQNRIDSFSVKLFEEPLPIIKEAYLKLQLDRDWMMQPLRRADSAATFLYSARVIRRICQMAYLLDLKPYPPDKWLMHYMNTTRFGRKHKKSIAEYVNRIGAVSKLRKGKKLMDYPLYRDAMALVTEIGEVIRKRYNDPPWVVRWYNYSS
ncbi:nucleotidyltransferase domain-containing protein [Candidatus Hydrogenedentota bacterium]